MRAGLATRASRERERYAALFESESRALLASAVDALGTVSGALAEGGSSAGIDAVFRAVHSLKGMAGAMEYPSVVVLAHEVETALASLRDTMRTPSASQVAALVDAVDALEAAVDAAVTGRVMESAAALAALRAAFDHLSVEATAATSLPVTIDVALLPGTVIVRLRVASDAPLPGARALLAVRRLESLGTVDVASPPLDALFDDGFDGALVLRLRTAATPADVERAARAAGQLDDVRVESAALSAARLTTASDAAAHRRPAAVRSPHVRVDRARLDALLDVAGELTLARARLTAAAAGIADTTLTSAIADVARLIGVVHEEVRSARTSPASEVFGRLARVVRDVARDVGKRAELVIEGGGVALDRSLLEELSEPLVHLLRNAVDHGLEEPAERATTGKATVGRIVLRAARERDAVIVSVCDDGRGIDRARLAARAGQEAAVEVDDDALLALLARPGFSTAEAVTSVSGRGVGVDAVLDRLRGLGGTMQLTTTPGAGTCFTLRLPLTLALGHALVARVGGESYALPVTNVRETTEIAAESRQRVDGREIAWVRDEALPVVRLGDALGVASAAIAASNPQAPNAPAVAAAAVEAVIIEAAGRRAALLVDAIDGEQELVVKRLPAVRGTFRFFGGATILADGTPALVLDVYALVSLADAGPHRILA